MQRKIICADAITWMQTDRNLGSIVTSLPDMEEVSMSEADYLVWFVMAARLCMRSTSPGHPTIFYQTDRLFKGKRISKAQLIMRAADAEGRQLVWHKIALRRDAGKIDLRRPGYSHLICFGDEKVTAGKATPDVFNMGGQLYPNGTGIQAATVALQAALRHGPRVCDPFCGRGTIPAIAEALGFEKVIGVDIDPAQAAAAKATRLAKGGVVQKKNAHFFL